MKIIDHLNGNHKDYTIYDNYRSIACFTDGFKSSSRKVFSCIDKFKSFTKVDTVANTTSLETQYLHGSTNLEGVTVGMTQDFAGTNLIPNFIGQGYLGTRVAPQYGAPRYIKVKKSPVVDYVFRMDDFHVLINQEFEGHEIEPQFYVPILPMILLSTQSGIGNGYSQTIYSRNILDIVNYIKDFLDNKETNNTFLPYFKDFKGTITIGDNPNQYNIIGSFEIINTTTIIINDLPINYSIDKYIKTLEALEDDKTIKSFKDKSNKNKIEFEINCPRELTKKSTEELIKIFKLKSTITDTLTCIGTNNEIIVFNSIKDILDKYIEIRLEYYSKRKAFLIDKMTDDITILLNKIRFIQGIIGETITFKNKSKKDIENDLSKYNYDLIENSFDYLLNLNIYNLTKDKLEDYINKERELQKKLEDYIKKDIKDIWIEEINELLKALGYSSKDLKESKKVVMVSTPLRVNKLYDEFNKTVHNDKAQLTELNHDRRKQALELMESLEAKKIDKKKLF